MNKAINYKKFETDKFLIDGEWEDDLIWCPSQCYLPLLFNGKKYKIYLRWRWSDPWTATLFENEDGSPWIDLFEENIDFFTAKELNFCKERAILRAKEYLYKINT